MTEAEAYQTDTVVLGDKKVETSSYDRYKGVKGKTDRVAFISEKLIRAWRYYHRNTGFRMPTDATLQALLKTQLGEPEQRFGVTVFHYTTDEQGLLLDAKKCQGRVKLWSLSEGKYEELSTLHRQWPLLDKGWGEDQKDVLINCTDEKWQRMTYTPCPEAHWKTKEAWFKALKGKEKISIDKLKASIGRNLNDTEIYELLGAVPPGAAPGSTDHGGDVDLGDVIGD